MTVDEITALLRTPEFARVIADAANYVQPDAPLRVAIGLDAFVDSFARKSVLGMTISSRAATACAHQHLWGKLTWWLLDRVWPFGCDKDGTPHCVSAIRRDAARGLLLALALISDPVVNDFCAKHPTKPTYKEL